MNEWIIISDGSMDHGWMDDEGWMDREWIMIDGWMNDGCIIDGWIMDGWRMMDGLMMDGWINNVSQMDGRMDEWWMINGGCIMDGWWWMIDGWMDNGWINHGWLIDWMDGWMDVETGWGRRHWTASVPPDKTSSVLHHTHKQTTPSSSSYCTSARHYKPHPLQVDHNLCCSLCSQLVSKLWNNRVFVLIISRAEPYLQ